MLEVLNKIFGNKNSRIIKSMHKMVKEINSLEPEMQNLSDDGLLQKTSEFKHMLNSGKTLNDILVPAFAAVREASVRILDMRHFDMQLVGGIVLHKGMIAEMKTGEGKTLVATLAVYLNALNGNGVHVVTVNDYLAKRDSEWMGKLYKFLGLSVDCIFHEMNDQQRQEAYLSDITYGTNNEFGFDYLRDNMRFDTVELVQRGHRFAIVDEVDSILIDEARTPLIISGAVEDKTDLYIKINAFLSLLSENDYEIDEKNKLINLTEIGSQAIESKLINSGHMEKNTSLYDIENMNVLHHINVALKAHKIFIIDVDYIVKDNKVIIIDEFTGRMMEGRRYSEGLHQAIEAKEGVMIQQENKTLASITFQNYFRMYEKLSGMTGTAKTEEKEFFSIYSLTVVQIPTNLPVKREDLDDEIYASINEKYEAVIKLVQECYEKKQPVLLGTVSIDKSEYISTLLKKSGLKHEVLNARYHEKEAQIIAQAGRPGSITLATNMAGRGTDIQLGGNAEMLIRSQLSNIKDKSKRYKEKERIILQIEADKNEVIEAGGLFVICTERHESRRIDNQLRGRSGRQGDPGKSKFFLSLEDDLLRIFGSDKIKGLLQKLGLSQGEAIHHPWISSALEKAQMKIEARNFEIRKSLLKFDDIMNEQRHSIFGQRKGIIESTDFRENFDATRLYINNIIVSTSIPKNAYIEDWDVKHIHSELLRIYGLDLDISSFTNKEGVGNEEVLDYLNQETKKLFMEKEESYGLKIINDVQKRILIVTLDNLWQDHLGTLDYLRQGINLRAIGQKDPLNEFKKEAFLLFGKMIEKFKENILLYFSHIRIYNNESGEEDDKGTDNKQGNSIQIRNNDTVDSSDNNNNIFKSVSRNALCPCGSKKRYKHCHGDVRA